MVLVEHVAKRIVVVVCCCMLLSIGGRIDKLLASRHPGTALIKFRIPLASTPGEDNLSASATTLERTAHSLHWRNWLGRSQVVLPVSRRCSGQRFEIRDHEQYFRVVGFTFN